METIIIHNSIEAASRSINHNPAGRNKNGQIFFDIKGNDDIFVVWRPDSSLSIELFYKENEPNPEGYPESTVKEFLIWCGKCNRDSLLNMRLDEENKGLPQYKFWGGDTTSVVGLSNDSSIDTILTDTIATPNYFIFTHPIEGSLLEKCWKRLYWELLKPDIISFSNDTFTDLNEIQRQNKVHNMRMSLRYNPGIGRKAFIKLFTVHRDKVLAKLQEYGNPSSALDM